MSRKVVDVAEVVQTTRDGIIVKKGDIVEVSINGGEWMEFASINDRSDASFAIAKCRQGSWLALDGRTFRNRIVRKGMYGCTVYEKPM